MAALDILVVSSNRNVSHRPIVSVQCKNGMFNMDEARKSVGAGKYSLSQHGGLQSSKSTCLASYSMTTFTQRCSAQNKCNFVPLGITDLASLEQKVSVELI